MMIDSNESTDFGRRSRQVVESFVQNVVILDDRAWMGQPPEDPVGPVTSPEYGQSSVSSTKEAEAGRTVGVKAAEGALLNAKLVVDRFAELGAICAVLKPDLSEDCQDKVVNAAKRSDIVVLDWKIADSYGEVTLDVIRGILKSDQYGERLRLLVIYTGEPVLPDISEEVKRTIGEFYHGMELNTDGPFWMCKGPVTVVILAKEETVDAGNVELHRQEVSENELPDRLMGEFAKMTQGLLTNVALAGLANLRGQTYRLLSKFDNTLDPAYLGHRLLLPNPPDAEDHVVEALGAEILSILEDAQPGKQAAVEAIREWLSDEADRDLNVREPFGPFWGDEDTLDQLAELLEHGRDGVECCWRPSHRKWECVAKRATAVFSKDCGDPTNLDHDFAALLGQKTRYRKSEPRLTLGTVICTRKQGDDDGKYYFCLQPKCDSVRLKSVTAFPLLPLKTRKVTQEFSLVVKEAETGDWIRLDYDPKPNLLQMTLFEPGSYPPGEVRACSRPGGKYFRDTSGTEYKWVADIKDEHASAIAVKVGNSLSRPGPNYAEWHRRAMPRV